MIRYLQAPVVRYVRPERVPQLHHQYTTPKQRAIKVAFIEQKNSFFQMLQLV